MHCQLCHHTSHICREAISHSVQYRVKSEILRPIRPDVIKRIYDSEVACSVFCPTTANGSVRLLIVHETSTCAYTISREFRNFCCDLQGYEPLLPLAKAECITTLSANMVLCQALESVKSTACSMLLASTSISVYEWEFRPRVINSSEWRNICGEVDFVVAYVDDYLMLSRG